MTKVYFIIGCTANGKGSLGRELAGRVGGQIVSVDSMKVYRRMDIGTAKPTVDQLSQVPHHCINLVEPSESFSVAQYVSHADAAIESINNAGSAAFAVGGTSLYIKALSQGLFEGPQCDEQIRAELKARADEIGLTALHQELSRVDPEAAGRIHRNDERRIIRAMEVYRTTGKPISELQTQWESGRRRYDCVFIGLLREKDEQSRRINARVKRMAEAGLRDEVASLLAEPDGMSPQAAAAVGYAEMISHLRGELTLEQAIERIKINTRRLAKKQRTWHRRFDDVNWFDVQANETAKHVADRIMEKLEVRG